MNGRLRLGRLALATACLTAIPFLPQTLSGQEATARFRVLVPDIQRQGDVDKKFGERLADELRDLINEMSTHQPIEEKELKQALRQYDLDMEDLDCTRSRQLAGLISARVVFCGTYSAEGQNDIRVDAMFVTAGGEEFQVDPVVVPKKDGQKAAAQHFYQALQLQSDQARYSQFCGDYATSNQWDDALNMCTQALELNPNAVGARFTLGAVYKNLEDWEKALEQFQKVLELDALNEDAMQNAGWAAAKLGRDDEAREYYEEYLQLNPGNAGVRMSVAYELAQAGDPLGAMLFIEEGLELEPDNVDLLKQHGGFAFTAGAELNQSQAEGQGQQEMSAEAAELFRKALDSYERVYALEGADMEAGLLLNMVRANINLRQNEEAVDLAQRALETHPDEAALWSMYGDALQRTGQLDEAIAALDRVRELDPGYANIAARQGSWLLQAGRVEEAVPILQRAVDSGEQSADRVALIVFGNAANEGIGKKNWTHAIRVIRLAKEFDVSDLTKQQLDFWLGYSIIQSAMVQQEPNTLETARASKPRFEEALRLLQTSGDYAQRNNYEGDRQNLISAATQYIEIQDAIIRRGK